MTTITEFLLARIEEDDAVAGVAEYEGYWLDDGEATGRFLEHHSPSRVLAECEAKRRIVELHALEDSIRRPDTDMKVYVCKTCDVDDLRWTLPSDVDAWPCDTIRALAAIYADHPDYREEWR